MGEKFVLPDLGEGLEDAEIVTWHVGVGDHVVIDQPLVSVETDKALVDIPAPHSGRISALFGKPGDVIAVGAPLVEYQSGEAHDRGAIVGDIGQPGEPVAPIARSHQAAHAKAAPAVRRLAQQLGVNLEDIAASGPAGSITKADVEAAAASHARPIRGVRRTMLVNMSRAGREVVPATLNDEADVDAWPAGTDTTVRLIRAVCAGCAASPSLNAWFDATRQERSLHADVDLGLAVESEDGLFAPVIRKAGARDYTSLREEIERIKAAISSRSIPRSDLVGPTITLSNFGMYGGRFAELVVVPPQVAILGAGRAEARVVAVEGVPAVRRMLPLSLSFDHRVVTGIEATRFLNAAIDELEKPN